ncbi:MAG: hypothetical protein ACM3TN_18935 [Alphaproteobacteria bacterium]
MNKLGIVFVAFCMLYVTSLANGQELRSPPAKPATTLKQFLQKYVSDYRFGTDKTTRFSTAFVKRGDGTIEQVVVYISGQSWCGSGGCTLLIMEPHNSSYNVISRTTIVRLPIRVLQHKTNGRHDIGVWVQGGGIQTGYEAVLQFNGRTYPANPTVPPAKRLTEKAAGEVLIPRTENGQPLFE